MPETLGEKLRQAREARGLTLGQVADQTRISAQYLESIENDDYRPLPGGIFNKGFVKSFAKSVGVNEQEALMDYNRQVTGSEAGREEELKVYRPQVLTDDRNSGSMVPTVIAAVLVLGLMTAGILFLLNYLRRAAEPGGSTVTGSASNNLPTPGTSESPTAEAGPDMSTVRIEVKATTQPVRLMATSDGTKSDNVVAAGSSAIFEPKESLTLNYNRWNAPILQLLINGKPISLPSEPLDNPKAQRIDFTINKDNLAQIWNSGVVGQQAPAITNVNAEVPRPSTSAGPAATPRPSAPSNRTPGNANPARSQPTPRPAANTVPRPVRTPTE
jgi:cytoskeletal protein RodZ